MLHHRPWTADPRPERCKTDRDGVSVNPDEILGCATQGKFPTGKGFGADVDAGDLGAMIAQFCALHSRHHMAEIPLLNKQPDIRDSCIDLRPFQKLRPVLHRLSSDCPATPKQSQTQRKLSVSSMIPATQLLLPHIINP